MLIYHRAPLLLIVAYNIAEAGQLVSHEVFLKDKQCETKQIKSHTTTQEIYSGSALWAYIHSLTNNLFLIVILNYYWQNYQNLNLFTSYPREPLIHGCLHFIPCRHNTQIFSSVALLVLLPPHKRCSL